MINVFDESISNSPELNKKHAKIITIEGIDGSGKTTLVNKLVEYLNNNGYQAKHFYTNSNFNCYWKNVNELLKIGLIDNYTNQILHNLIFVTYIKTNFIKLLNENDFVVSEWYIYGKMLLSELYEDKDEADSKKMLDYFVKQNDIVLPDYSFYLDLPIDVAVSRINVRNEQKESKESKEMLLNAKKRWDKYVKKYNMFILDATQDSEELLKEVTRRIIK